MKKIMIFAAFTAALSLASCQKEGLNEVVKNDPSAVSESPVFTGTINAGTKTTVVAASGKVSWETTDEITVTDKDQKTADYSIESIDGSTGRATFVYKSGDTLGEGPYTATYGTAPATDQTYSATPGELYMTATATSGTSLEFTVQCALMEINLTKSGESVSSVAVTGTPTDGTETTYTLTCTEAQSIETTKSFYIAVPAGVYNKIVITDSDDKVCTLTAASGITVAANHIKPLTFAGSKLDFKPNLPAGALKGVFSISNDDGMNVTQIYFSQGNLWYGKVGDAQTATFNFEANQYDTTPTSDGDWSTNHISHFYWSKDERVAYSDVYDTANSTYVITPDQDDVFFTNADGFKVNVGGTDQTGWRTLSTEEWQYLFDTRTFNNGANTGEGYSYQRATIINSDATSVYGVILYPDNYTLQTGATSYTSTEWTTMEENGCVFLPAAGNRSFSNVDDVGVRGYYWSSTAFHGDDVYRVDFNSSHVFPDYSEPRCSGCSVRLITE